jgi:hypothetical protein
MNDAPDVTTPLSDVTCDEDFTQQDIDLAASFSDPDNDQLTYTATSSETGLIASIDGHILHLNSLTNWNGTAAITVTASDAARTRSGRNTTRRLSVSDEFTVTVTPVNDPPLVAIPFPDLTLAEDFPPQSITLAGHFSDVDNTNLIYAATSNPEQIVATIENGILTLSPALNWHGVTVVSVIASDGSLSTSDAFNVTVAPVNDAPVLTDPFENITLTEDFGTQTVILTTHFFDPDGQTLNYTVASNHDQILSGFLEGQILLTSVLNWTGTTVVTITANDGTLSTSDDFNVFVTPINDAPVVSVPFQDLTRDENFDTFSIPLADHFTDVDNSILTYTADFTEAGIGVEIMDGNLVVSSVEGWSGVTTISVSASDAGALTRSVSRHTNARLSVTDSFTLTVNNTGVGDHDLDKLVTCLRGAFPNPFNGETTIRYSLEKNGPISIKLYNLKGEAIASLVDGQNSAGDHSILWEGHDQNGRAAASGVYLVIMRTGDKTLVQRITYMK